MVRCVTNPGCRASASTFRNPAKASVSDPIGRLGCCSSATDRGPGRCLWGCARASERTTTRLQSADSELLWFSTLCGPLHLQTAKQPNTTADCSAASQVQGNTSSTTKTPRQTHRVVLGPPEIFVPDHARWATAISNVRLTMNATLTTTRANPKPRIQD